MIYIFFLLLGMKPHVIIKYVCRSRTIDDLRI